MVLKKKKKLLLGYSLQKSELACSESEILMVTVVNDRSGIVNHLTCRPMSLFNT